MKIGIDVRLWDETGVGRYIRNLVKNLTQIDAKNDYVLFVLKKDKEKVSQYLSVAKTNKWKLVIADIPWHSIREQVLLAQILKKENLDLMHFPYFSIPLNYKKPYVITIHDLIINNFPTGKASTLPLPLYYAKRQAYKKVLKDGISNAKAVILPTDAVKKDVENLFPTVENVFVTNEGVDEDLKKVTDSELYNYLKDIPYFLYVGNAYPHKNVEFMIEAFKHFKDTSNSAKPAHLILVGREDYFYKRLERQDLEKYSIMFLHNVNDQDLSFLYTHAQALIAPSLSEGFGLTTLEAMKLGCLVLASHIPPFHEICDKWALYFDPRKKEELVHRMENVLKMDEVEKNMYKKGAIKNLARFSWKKMTQETLEIYEKSL